MQDLQNKILKDIMIKNVIQLQKIVCFKDIIIIQILKKILNGEFLKNKNIMNLWINLNKEFN